MGSYHSFFAGIHPQFTLFWMSIVLLIVFLWFVMSRVYVQHISTKESDIHRMLSLLEDAYRAGRIDKETYLRQRDRLLKIK
ncbi:hypothetical protein FHQ08_05385 [Lactobacillus sp. CC-MHH1034]|nr:hypothetical protein [Agrilactobacillus fermenti]